MPPRLLALFCLVSAGAGFGCAVFFKGLSFGRSQGEPGMGSDGLVGVAISASSAPEGRNGAAQSLGRNRGKERPRSLRDILGLVEDSSSPSDMKLVLMEAVNRLDAGALEQVLAEAVGSANFFRTLSPDFEYAARRLSEIAPERAAALWRKGGGGLLGGEKLLLPWANRNPGAFASWSLDLPQGEQKALGGVLKELARTSPQRFAEIAPQLAQSPGGAAGARGAMECLLANEAAPKGGWAKIPEAALAYAKNLPEGALRSAALVEVAQSCDLRKVDLVAHPEMRDALASLSPLEARNVAKKFTDTADKLPQGALRESAFAAQISAVAAKDPKSAAKKVEAFSGSADYPAAVRGFVEATAAKDPAAAADWALSIGPQGGQRTAALEKAAAEYFRQKPDEARKWVATAPLSAEEYFLLTGFRR
jgi:hypothetical protein